MRDLGPRLPDSDILDIAVSETRLVVTMDKDFGELVYRSRRTHAGALLLRLEAATGDEKVEVIRAIFDNYADEIDGRFAVYQNGRLRIRR